MGRFNWIWRTSWTLSVLVCALGMAERVSAFEDSDVVQTTTTAFGNCTVTRALPPPDNTYGWVYVRNDGGDLYAGGGYYKNNTDNNWYDEEAPISESTIKDCLGLSNTSQITTFGQNGGAGETFANDNYVGFIFTLSVQALGKSAGEEHEYKVGSGTLYSTSNAPTNLAATPGDGQVSVTFTAPTDTGGAAITDYEYQLDTGTWTTASTTNSPVVITGLTNGTSYSIKLRAINTAGDGTASEAESVLLGSPATAFEEAEAEVQAIITQDATRSLNSTLSSSQRMTRGARSRFIDNRSQSGGDGAGLATRNNVPFDIDGTFDLDGARLSTKGKFFGQTGNVEGTERRLVFGDFDVQRDGDTGSTTATLTGRVAWEQMTSDDTMLGYFVGGELADSNISGTFDGSQTRVAATAGGYAVHALSETLFADGFISIGAGRNNLEMADDVLALESTYTTRTATVGGALTGVYAYERYELRPEMAFSYGKTWIGDVGFTGVAYGLTDNTLSVDAGTVSTASLTLRPEIVWALDADAVAESHAQLSFAPRLICERTMSTTTSKSCGAGAEIGLSSNSEDGLSIANIRFVVDRVGNSKRSSVVLNLEHRF